MEKKLIIFDLDGTLLYTLEDLYRSVNFGLESEGLPLRSIDEVRSFVGNGVRRLVGCAVPEGTPEEKAEAVFAAFKAHYTEHCTDTTAPYEGITGLLSLLREKGCALGVVSNKSDAAAKVVIDHYFPGVFDSVVGERENVRKKPAPDSVIEVTESLGFKTEDSVYIGDSEVDIMTARNAGCDCICVSWGYRSEEFLKENGAKTICSDVEELKEILL